MDCFHHALDQVQIRGFVRRTKTKLADKMAAAYVYAVEVTLTRSILIEFLPNFIHGLFLSHPRLSLNTGLV